MSVASLLSDVLGDDVPAAFRAYDGSSLGPPDARTTIVVRSPDALRCWVRNLESNWDAAVAEVGPGRARVWRLSMAAAAVGFEHDDNQIHQVLATVTTNGDSGTPLRPQFT